MDEDSFDKRKPIFSFTQLIYNSANRISTTQEEVKWCEKRIIIHYILSAACISSLNASYLLKLKKKSLFDDQIFLFFFFLFFFNNIGGS